MKRKPPNNTNVEQLIFALSTFMWKWTREKQRNENVLLQFIVSWRADVFKIIFQHLFPNILTNFGKFAKIIDNSCFLYFCSSLHLMKANRLESTVML